MKMSCLVIQNSLHFFHFALFQSNVIKKFVILIHFFILSFYNKKNLGGFKFRFLIFFNIFIKIMKILKKEIKINNK